MAAAAVVALTHDLVQKRSFATVVWENKKDKWLVLPIPFGCAVEDARDDAEKGIRNLELSSLFGPGSKRACSAAELSFGSSLLNKTSAYAAMA